MGVQNCESRWSKPPVRLRNQSLILTSGRTRLSQFGPWSLGSPTRSRVVVWLVRWDIVGMRGDWHSQSETEERKLDAQRSKTCPPRNLTLAATSPARVLQSLRARRRRTRVTDPTPYQPRHPTCIWNRKVETFPLTRERGEKERKRRSDAAQESPVSPHVTRDAPSTHISLPRS